MEARSSPDVKPAQSAQKNAVFVTNISPGASEKTVTDFFSFCGKIVSLSLRTLDDSEGTKEAKIEFQEEAAAKTALLLTNALIIDRPINVVLYINQKADEHNAEASDSHVLLEGDEIRNRPNLAPASERSHTSVIASLLAAGYMLGAETAQKAREFDEEHHISTTLKQQADNLRASAREWDEYYKISETASSWGTSASNWFSGWNQQLGLSEKATTAKQSSSDVIKSVGESEIVAKTAEGLNTAKDAVVGYAGMVKDEAARFISEQQPLQSLAATLAQGKEAVQAEVQGIMGETSRLISRKEEQHHQNRATGSLRTGSAGEEEEEEEEDDREPKLVIEDEDKADVNPPATPEPVPKEK